VTPYWVQAVLIGFYLVLAGLFARKETLPLSIYYVGCFVKDAAVMALALWRR
jgi:hypothetical protein